METFNETVSVIIGFDLSMKHSSVRIYVNILVRILLFLLRKIRSDKSHAIKGNQKLQSTS